MPASAAAAPREVVISAGPGGHFVAGGAINGRAARFMVDTGATLVSIGRDDALRMGLDLQSARRSITQTANGPVPVQTLTLASVRVGEVEGVVTEVAALATKIVNIRNEEVTIPNAVLVANPIHNYSKLAGTHGTLLSTKVTIGYDAPWRQVHALLQQAAAATEGLRTTPEPRVFQRALSDFYVEYELLFAIDKPIERIPTLSRLHAAIQDAFNEAGVQIMSPHFFAQPERPVVVPKSQWDGVPPAAS
jgi:clan AA aspartic protease (TIGR02281 family)